MERLPRHSYYKAALEDDDDFARIALSLKMPGAEAAAARVPLVGYDPTIARLDNVFDAVNAVNETLVAVYSKRRTTGRPNRAPRPETAQQRVARQQKLEKLDSIVDRMIGGR